MKKITRSNSEENISLNPISSIIHSKPTSHGAGQRNFAARDDASGSPPSSSTNQHIVSSPSQNASSALAVLDILPLTFGAIRGYLPDRERLRTISIPDQQPTVGYTKDLSLPIDFLPGEDEIKLQEDITYRSSTNRKMLCRGEIILTKYRLLFITKSSDATQILMDVPLGMISQIQKVGGQTRSNISDGASYGIEVTCKDLRTFFFCNEKEQHQRKNLYEHLTRLIFPFSITEIDVTNPIRFFSTFFAWNYKKKVCPDKIDEGWTIYNKIRDYTRMGIQQRGESRWIIDANINKKYELCDTYPDTLVIPSKFEMSRLQNVAAFRSRNRIPVLSWYCRETCATITRASQPLTGLNRKCQDDMDYLREIADANINQNSKLFILDARPKVNAIANKPNGGGYENYPDCELEFQHIQNIHVMRESLNKLYLAIRQGQIDEKTSISDVENFNWLFHIKAVLTSVNRIVSLIHNDKRSVLVHCSDGWDRTAQLTSLSMLLLDPYYRTLDGFMVLVEKEWISFGHKFFLRIGHGDKAHSERSPIFVQFLECTYQLIQQFESAFEFNETFLITLADCLYTCQYGTFLLNSEKNRVDMKISEYTMSVWTPILYDRQTYTNPNYNSKLNQVLQINLYTNQILLWKNYYFRSTSDYQPISESRTSRTSTLSNLRTKLTNEFNHLRHSDENTSQQQSRPQSFILSGTQTTS